MERYFRLWPDCFLVEGNNDAVVYAVPQGRLLLLDRKARDIVRACESNRKLDESWCDERGIAFLTRLQAEGLGAFDESPAFVEKLAVNAPVRLRGMAVSPIGFYRVALALTDACDLECDFCPRDRDGVSWQSCISCVRDPGASEDPGLFAEPELLIDQIAALGVTVLDVRGGNPLLRWDRLTRVLDAAARHPNLRVIITTPGTGRAPDQVASLLSGRRVRINIVALAADEEDAAACCCLSRSSEDGFSRCFLMA